MLNLFSFDCELHYKNTWFLRQRIFAHFFDLFKTRCVFINKNSVFEVEACEEGTHTNESVMLKIFLCVRICQMNILRLMDYGK